jgi:hypothetical protein
MGGATSSPFASVNNSAQKNPFQTSPKYQWEQPANPSLSQMAAQSNGGVAPFGVQVQPTQVSDPFSQLQGPMQQAYPSFGQPGFPQQQQQQHQQTGYGQSSFGSNQASFF